jgi:hypothetical protein
MAQLMIPPSGGPESFQYGMNDYNNAKTLKRNCQQLIQNMYPNDTGLPRNGMNEKMSDTTAIGHGTEHVFYQPHSKYVSFGGKEFFFQWAKNVTTTDEFELEVWNLTDGGRTKLIYGDFNQTDVHISMKVLYDAVYVTLEYEMATARENAYRTRNKILEWSGSAWTVREMGIDVAPSPPLAGFEASDLSVMDAVYSLQVFNGVIYTHALEAGGIDDSRKIFKSSADGAQFVEVGVDALPFACRRTAMVVFNNKLWVLGGEYGGSSECKKVFSSDDGVVWTEVGTNALPISGALTFATVYDNKLWVISNLSPNRKVYNTTDGVTWTRIGVTPLPADAGEFSFIFSYAGKMWLFGGITVDSKKLHTSTDGLTWTEVGSAVLPTSTGDIPMGLVEYGGKMWYGPSYAEFYSSVDGEVWDMAAGGTPGLTPSLFAVLGGKVVAIRPDYDDVAQPIRSYSTTDFVTLTKMESGINKNKYISLAFTFVKKALNGGQDTEQFEEPIVEGIEDLSKRQIVYMAISGDYGYIGIKMPPVADAVAQGATHMRVWRTLEATTATIAAGLDHRYLCDLCITGAGYSSANIYLSAITDLVMSGETNVLNVTGYDTPPMGRYFDFDVRSWIGGNPSNPGYWFFSETPSNVQFPQKYASMFRTGSGYWMACDPDDGQKDSGTILYKGDRYFFKERKIFVLHGADVNNVPQLISDPIGCAFPQTITRLYIPQFGGECIGFLSEYGPAVLLPGGTVQLMTEFSIAALYPRENGIIKKSNGLPTSWYTRNKVTAAFWDSTWWVLFGDSRDTGCELTTNKIYGMHFERDADAIGPFELAIPQYTPVSTPYTILEPLSLIPVDNNRCYAFSHKTNASAAVKYRLVQFCDPTKYQDTFVTEGALSYSMVYESAYRFAQSRQCLMGVARKLLVYIKFADTNGLTLTVTSDDGRLVATRDYSQTRTSGVLANVAVRDVIQLFLREDMIGHKFKVQVSKVVPTTGAVEMFGHEIELDAFDREPEFSDGSEDLSGDTVYVSEATQE